MKTQKNFAWVAIIATALFALSVTGCPGNDDPGSNNGDQNQAPTANAGTDFEHNITTSGTTITLNGSGTDTDGSITAYAWTCTDKPNDSATPTFSNSAVASPTVSGFDTLGDYEFSLKVKDNENKESTAGVVKVSLCMTASKNVEVSFAGGISADGLTLDFTPTYTPVIAGSGFENSDVVYYITNNTTDDIIDSTTNFKIESSIFTELTSVDFIQIFEYSNGTEIKRQTVTVSVGLFGDFIGSTIPSIDITLSKKVSAGAIPVTVTKDVTVSFPAFEEFSEKLNLTPTYTPNGGWGEFSADDVVYTVEDDSSPTKRIWTKTTGFEINADLYADNTYPMFTQTFTYNNGIIKSQSIKCFAYDMSGTGQNDMVFCELYDQSLTTQYDEIPQMTFTISKQVEKE